MKASLIMGIALGTTLACSRSMLGVDDLGPEHVATNGQPLLCRPGDPPVVLARANFVIWGNLAIGATHASWWNTENGEVYAAPLTGGDAVRIGTGPDDPGFDGRVLFRDGDVLWSGDAKSFDWSGGSGGWIRTVTPGGAPAILLQKLDNPVLLSATGDALTWATSTSTAGADGPYSYGIAQRAADGAITTVPIGGVSGDKPLSRSRTALAGAALVVATTDTVATASLADGTSTVLARGVAPWVVVADDASAYWLDSHRGGHSIVRAPLAGGGALTTIVPNVTGFVLGVAGNAVYFEDGSSITKVSLADGARSTVLDAGAQDSSPHPGPSTGRVMAYGGMAADIAFDASCVYVAYPNAIVRVPQ